MAKAKSDKGSAHRIHRISQPAMRPVIVAPAEDEDDAPAPAAPAAPASGTPPAPSP